MSEPLRRLIFFALGLLLWLAALEWLVRHNSALFEAASHRALTKVAIFQQHPRVEILFLGTSRTQDGVSPALVSRTIQGIAPELGPVPGFNAAFTAATLDLVAAQIPRFGFRPDLKVVVLELSAPELAPEFLNFPIPWEQPRPASRTVEDKLAAAVQHVHFIRHRTAFLTDNLNRLPPLLLFAASLGGWETITKDQLAAWLGRPEPAAAGFDAALWTPELPGAPALPQTLNPQQEEIATRLVRQARLFQDHGIKVVFTVPPLARGFSAAPERQDLKPLFAEVARRSRCEVWNFATVLPPDVFFRDATHLGGLGRAHYSQALGVQLARVLKGG